MGNRPRPAAFLAPSFVPNFSTNSATTHPNPNVEAIPEEKAVQKEGQKAVAFAAAGKGCREQEWGNPSPTYPSSAWMDGIELLPSIGFGM
jgi:hypothetical protein